MEPAERYDALYAVSDLHLGGPPGRQMFDQGAELAGLVRYVAGLPASRRVALVLNGDIVDFLAEDGAGYFVPEAAVGMLARMAADPAFADVFRALAELVRTPGRELCLVIGNHDVELGLPHVQRWLVAELAGEDAAARGRIRFHMDGAGLGCLVGRARVLCLHGNDQDEWNVVDHEALRRVRSRLNRARRPDEWPVNAGTKLVIDVLNGLKARYAWLDLLKPETTLVPRLLVALDPTTAVKLKRFLPAFLRTCRGRRQQTSYLSAAPRLAAEGSWGEEPSDEQLMAEFLAPCAGESRDADTLLAQAEHDFGAGVSPVGIARSEGGEQTLGLMQYLVDRVRGVSDAEALRRALRDWLGGDQTFEVDHADALYHALNEAVDPGVHFLVAGHSHLERAIRRRHGYYFNSGTWIRLMRMSDAVLANEASFGPTFEALTREPSTLAHLDAVEGLIVRRASVVVLEDTGDSTTGELARVVMKGGVATLKPVPRSRFVREG